MRSPRYRSITGRSVQLPLLLLVAMTAMTVGLSTATGWLLGAAAGSRSDHGRGGRDRRACGPRALALARGRRRRHRPDHHRRRGRAGPAGHRRACGIPGRGGVGGRYVARGRPGALVRQRRRRADGRSGRRRHRAGLRPGAGACGPAAVRCLGRRRGRRCRARRARPGCRAAGPGRAGPPGAAAARLGDPDPRAAGPARGRGRRRARAAPCGRWSLTP